MTDEHPFERPPTSEEEMRAATVGELVVHGATIHLADYDPAWPRLFEREATRIRSILGRPRPTTGARRLDVRPRASPPSRSSTSSWPSRIPPMSRPTCPTWRRPATCCGSASRTGSSTGCFKGPDTNINLHTYSEGCAEIDRYLAFRDWLRTHDDERELYERTKRELAAREWRYVQHYADAKTGVVEGIIARAQAGGALS